MYIMYIWINVANKIQWPAMLCLPTSGANKSLPNSKASLGRETISLDEMAPHPIYLQKSIHDSAQGIH